MKLYYLQGSCSLAIHVVLEWIGKPYASQAVSREELKQADFLALNPLGSAPAFVDEDLTLTQSTAILHYIAEKYPEANLLGETIQQRAEMRRWLGMLNSDVHRHIGLVFGVAGYAQNETCQQELQKNAKLKLHTFYAMLNQQMMGKSYLTGTRSIADAYLFVALRWAQRAQLDMSSFTALHEFFERMQQDTGVQAALRAEGLL